MTVNRGKDNGKEDSVFFSDLIPSLSKCDIETSSRTRQGLPQTFAVTSKNVYGSHIDEKLLPSLSHRLNTGWGWGLLEKVLCISHVAYTVD